MIDGRDHLVGRLASIVAKHLLNGHKIVVVRCEELVHSGAIYRSQRKAMQFRHKRTLTNPKKGEKVGGLSLSLFILISHRTGPYHHRSPSMTFLRVVRGMVPHKLPRGAAALANLKTFDGCPAPYDKVKKLVVPAALRALRLGPGKRYCKLGEVQARVGWSYASTVATLEEKRKTEAYAWHLKRKVERVQRRKAVAAANKAPGLKPFSALLSATGFDQ